MDELSELLDKAHVGFEQLLKELACSFFLMTETNSVHETVFSNLVDYPSFSFKIYFCKHDHQQNNIARWYLPRVREIASCNQLH